MSLSEMACVAAGSSSNNNTYGKKKVPVLFSNAMLRCINEHRWTTKTTNSCLQANCNKNTDATAFAVVMRVVIVFFFALVLLDKKLTNIILENAYVHALYIYYPVRNNYSEGEAFITLRDPLTVFRA